MNSFKGTPGPWSTPHFAVSSSCCDCKWVFSSEESGCLTIATINVAEGEENYEDPELEEAKYNALLISKAPDMLAMMESCLHFVELVREHGNIREWDDEDKLRNLIKEATVL